MLVISFDGFRYDYIRRNLTSNLVRLRSNGTYSEYMTSVFPTKTFPNHFTIATGVYVDVHGVLDNKVYDVKTKKVLNYSYELFHYNKEIVPIWILNERKGEGRHSGCMMWPGSNFEYQGLLPSFTVEYNGSVSWEKRVDTMISWFLDDKIPINFGMMYFEEPDYTTHIYGPDSAQVNKQIERVDSIIEYFIEKSTKAELLDKLNVVILSDHGGQNVLSTHVIDLDKYLDNSTYAAYGVSPNLQIYPTPGKEEEVLSNLKRVANESHFSVYAKDEIPDRWHYKDNNRTPPVFLVADVGYIFSDQMKSIEKWKDKLNITVSPNTTFGTHGYDPLIPTMRAFFLAFGPLMKRNYTVKPFVNIDLYNLFAHALNLDLPSISPNGSFQTVQDVFMESYIVFNDHHGVYIFSGIMLSVVILVSLLSLFIIRLNVIEKMKQRKSSNSSYRGLV